MLNINTDFYCVANEVSNNGRVDYCGLRGGEIELERCKRCKHCHRKHPTPEQYQQEYGEKYPNEGAVWILKGTNGLGSTRKVNPTPPTFAWEVRTYEIALSQKDYLPELYKDIVCACTPFGKPDADWRQE